MSAELPFNPFAFYGIHEQCFPDEAALRQTFLELSRKHHPDYFTADTPDHEEALHYAALNNKAWAVLSSFERRVEWLLQHHGFIREGEKNVLPAAFLAEMLDLHDLIGEALAGDMPAREQSESILETQIAEVQEGMAEAARTWDESRAPEAMKSLHEKFQEWRYLERLRRNFEEGTE
jgi:molecular chaperone HscB